MLQPPLEDATVSERKEVKRMAVKSKKATFDLSKWFNSNTSLAPTASIETVLSRPTKPLDSQVDLTKEEDDKDLTKQKLSSPSLPPPPKTEDKPEETEEQEVQADKAAASGQDATECYVCGAPDPPYVSTKAFKGVASVAVCGVACERDYLRAMDRKPRANDHREILLRSKRHTSEPLTASTPNKRLKRESLGKRQQRGGRKSRRRDDEGDDDEEEEDSHREEPEPEVFELDGDEEEEEDNELYNEDQVTDHENKRQRRSLRWFEESFEDEMTGSKATRSWWPGALAFFDFVYQRHGMWHSYATGDMDPKVDPELIRYGTCNIYRELDRSTSYLRKHVIRWQQAHQGKLSVREVLWMTIVFRLCNRLETFHNLKPAGIPSTDSYPKFTISIATYAKRHSDKEMFGARRNMTMIRYLGILDKLLEDLDTLTIRIKESESSKQVFETLQAFHDNALGSFTCWQVTADLMELYLLGKREADDEFVWLSADAKLSLEQIFGKRRARATEGVSLAKVLQLRQIQAFRALEVDFPFYSKEKLNLKNIGHALHGFQQYRNIKLIQFRRQGRFKSLRLTCQPKAYDSRSYMADNDVCEVCEKGGDDDKSVLCDLCNRSFHSYCLGMDELPPASWVCADCQNLNERTELGLVEPTDPSDPRAEESGEDKDENENGV